MIVVTTMQLTTNVCDFDVDRQRAALRSNLAYSLTTAHSYQSERERKNSERIELQWVNIYGWKKNSLPKLFHCNENACLKIDWQKCIQPEISIKMDRTGISLGAGWQKHGRECNKKVRHRFGRAHWMALTITTMKKDRWKAELGIKKKHQQTAHFFSVIVVFWLRCMSRI